MFSCVSIFNMLIAMDKYEYDVKILKENKDESTHINDKEIKSGFVGKKHKLVCT